MTSMSSVCKIPDKSDLLKKLNLKKKTRQTQTKNIPSKRGIFPLSGDQANHTLTHSEVFFGGLRAFVCFLVG